MNKRLSTVSLAIPLAISWLSIAQGVQASRYIRNANSTFYYITQSHESSRQFDPQTSTRLNESCLNSLESQLIYESIAAAGVSFQWRVEGDYLYGQMEANTTGWIAVGFNTRSALAGTRLIMGYVQGDTVVVEEHIADPPNHYPKTQIGGIDGLSEVSGTELDGITRIRFRLLLDTGDGEVPLIPGDTYFATFAWSHEDDLDHHSARRDGIHINL